jgi:hypothetical protein
MVTPATIGPIKVVKRITDLSGGSVVNRNKRLKAILLVTVIINEVYHRVPSNG